MLQKRLAMRALYGLIVMGLLVSLQASADQTKGSGSGEFTLQDSSILKKLLAARELLPIDRMGVCSVFKKSDWPARGQELLENLQRNLYGWTPTSPRQVSGRVVWEDPQAYNGKARHQRIELNIVTPGGTHTLPFHLLTPNAVSHPPVMLNLAFRPRLSEIKMPTDYAGLSHSYLAIDEILDNGFALAVVALHDISPDIHNGNYLLGLGSCFSPPMSARRKCGGASGFGPITPQSVITSIFT